MQNFKTEVSSFRAALAQAPAPRLRWDVLGVRRQTHKFFNYLLNEHISPARMAAAVFVGVVVGVTPFFGFHLPLCIGLSLLFRLNKIIVYTAANISIPPLAPLIMFCNYQVGFMLLNGRFSTLSMKEVEVHGFNLFWDLVLGSLVVGVIAGSIAATAVYIVMTLKARTKASAVPAQARFAEAAVALFHGFMPVSKFAAYFAKGKVLGDPVYFSLSEKVPGTASVLDVGGGQGLASLILAYQHGSGPQRTVIDWDRRKLTAGQVAAWNLDLDVEFAAADVHQETAFPRRDWVLCIDVLHYNPPAEQDLLIGKMAAAVAPGGTLVIRDMDGSRGWRTRLTVLQEKFSLWFSLTLATKIYPRAADETARALEAQGFKVEVQPCWKGTVFANVLFMAQKI